MRHAYGVGVRWPLIHHRFDLAMGVSMKRIEGLKLMMATAWTYALLSTAVFAQASPSPEAAPAEPPPDAAQPPATASEAPDAPAVTEAPTAPEVPAEPEAPSTAAADAPTTAESTIGSQIAPAPASTSPATAPSAAAPSTPRSHPLLDRRPGTIVGWQSEVDLAANRGGYTGLSLRLSTGLGYGSAGRERGDDGRQRTSGLEGLLNIDVGSALSENLIFYGRLGGFTVNHVSHTDSPNAGNAYIGLIGMGLRYHLMPYDYYASGTLAVAFMTVTSGYHKIDNARPGGGVELELGKNWAVGTALERRSVGLGFRFSLVSCGAVPSSWTTTAYSLVFSTQFN